MSVLDNYSSSERKIGETSSHSWDVVAQQFDVEQLPFPDTSVLPDGTSQLTQQHTLGVAQVLPESFSPLETPHNVTSPILAPHITQALVHPMLSSGVTRELPELQTGALSPVVKNNTTALRVPVVIPGSSRKRQEEKSQHKGRHLAINIVATTLLVFILFGTLLTVLPLRSDGHGVFSLFKPMTNIVNSKNNNKALIAQQAATATAVTQGGFDPGPGHTYVGVPAAPVGYDTTGNHFFYGQCTFWGSERYFQLTGRRVPWFGNANQWAAGAANSGWIVSSAPHVPSIIVLQGGVQGASGGYGHVAVVESINADGTVHTSDWNWNGLWAQTSYVDFHTGPGVSFVWAPGK